MTAETLKSPAAWLQTAAKVGLSAKGLVYCLSGLIALAAAMDIGSNSATDAGKKGVFSLIEEQPFGKWLILVVALGLFCYTGWRWIQAFKDTEDKGGDKGGLAKRFTYFFSGLVYAVLGIYAINRFMGSESQGDQKQGWISGLLDQSYGQWAVGCIAAVMAGTGIYQLYRAFSGKYKKYVSRGLHQEQAKWISRIGVTGYSARGVVWLILGWLFAKAAINSNSKETGGSDAAFRWLQDSSYGAYLLGTVAFGLVCYGVFMFLRAKYQTIHT